MKPGDIVMKVSDHIRANMSGSNKAPYYEDELALVFLKLLTTDLYNFMEKG